MVKLLMAFVMAGILFLCAIYCTLVYYRLVAVAKANLTYGWIRSEHLTA
jgi:hypothetical protein